jgi:hypothetical protein
MEQVFQYYIASDVTIVGRLGTGSGLNGAPVIDGPIEIDDANVRLSRLTIRANPNFDGVNIHRGSRVHINKCEVYAGSEHDGVDVGDGALLMLESSYVWSTGFDGLYPNKSLYVREDAVAVVKDCTIESVDPVDAGFVVGQLYYASTTFLGNLTEYGNGVATELDATLEVSESTFRVGKAATVSGKASGAALLLLSLTGVSEPLDLGTGAPLLLSFPLLIFQVVADGLGTWSLSGDIPDDIAFVGVSAYFQQFDLRLGALSCVDAAVIGS